MTSRRSFLTTSLATTSLALNDPRLRADETDTPPFPKGKAEHCIFLWLGGGMGQMDTFDPKRQGNSAAKEAGSMYSAIDTAITGTQVCEHLSKCASRLDRFNIIRSVHHEVIDEHAAAVNRMHTGRPTTETVVYPSVGSVVAHQLGLAGDGVPAYVVIGYPNVTRGPGFLGARYGYVYLTDTRQGPAGLARSVDISESRQQRRERLLATVRQSARQQSPAVADYDAALAEALRLGGPQFQSIFQLEREPAETRTAYGGEFGQRCLLARRLIQSGVRFVEVSHNLNFINGTGWDVHNEGMRNQHVLIQELDTALAALVDDLEAQRLLDKTLIVVATEFGRPAQFDAGGGRGHHSKSFSIVLAGGGLKNGLTIGATDDLAMQIVDQPVSVPNLHATIYAALGINPAEHLYAGERPVPITDNGRPIAELFPTA